MTQKHIVEAPWKVAEPQGRRSEMARIETFLDFDPVFPGWPPEAVADEPQKGESNEQQHSDQRRRFLGG
jgi:hypothetical protein